MFLCKRSEHCLAELSIQANNKFRVELFVALLILLSATTVRGAVFAISRVAALSPDRWADAARSHSQRNVNRDCLNIKNAFRTFPNQILIKLTTTSWAADYGHDDDGDERNEIVFVQIIINNLNILKFIKLPNCTVSSNSMERDFIQFNSSGAFNYAARDKLL